MSLTLIPSAATILWLTKCSPKEIPHCNDTIEVSGINNNSSYTYLAYSSQVVNCYRHLGLASIVVTGMSWGYGALPQTSTPNRWS